MRKLKKSQAKEVKRITEYMISGGAYFWSGYATFFLVDKVFGKSFFWAKSISTLVGWLINYTLQRYWVFRNPALKKHQSEVTGRYVTITLVNFVLDYFIVYGLKLAGLTPYIGQFASSGFFTVWNYLWYKYWVFPEKFVSLKPKVGVARVVANRPLGPTAYQRRPYKSRKRAIRG
jgi:putative flippase GtrA